MLSRFLTVREQFILGGLGLAIMAGSASLIWYNRAQIDPALLQSIEVPAQEFTVDTHVVPIAPPPEIPASLPQPPVVAPVIAAQPVQPLVAAVQGAVKKPGSYTLTREGRVDDLIKAAGGATEYADLHDINLSAPLLDGVTLSIPEKTITQVDGKSIRMRGSQNPITLNPSQYLISSGYVPPRQHPISTLSPDAIAPGVSGPVNLNTATQAELEALPGIGPTYAVRIIHFRQQSPFRRIEDLLNVDGIGEKRFASIARLVTVQ